MEQHQSVTLRLSLHDSVATDNVIGRDQGIT